VYIPVFPTNNEGKKQHSPKLCCAVGSFKEDGRGKAAARFLGCLLLPWLLGGLGKGKNG
jgi:hypothetical protein